MALWVDKYRPTKLSDLTYHKDLASNLSDLVQAGNFPHLLFYGPDGSGKSTRIRCILKNLYGNGAENVKMEYRNFETASGKKLELMVISSLYHIEITPSDVGIHDRIVVQEIIKQMAQSQQIDSTTQKSFKVVVLMEADNLTRDAQHALRRTMEKYAGTCKIILCCNSVSKVIEPLRSRCMVIRVAAPNYSEMKQCIDVIVAAERIQISESFLKQLYDESNGNLRRAVILLEASVNQFGTKLAEQKIVKLDWQTYIHQTAQIMIKEQTSEGLLKVRNRIYELLSRCIPTNVVFEELLNALLPYCNPTIRNEVIESAYYFEHTSLLGSKDIYHLDAFVAAFMSIYKEYLATGGK